MSKYSKKREKMQVKTCPCENRDGVAGGQRRVCLPGGEVIINARAELLETAVEAGFQVVKAMLEEDVENLCGFRYCHQRSRKAFRWGETTGEVTLGGRRVGIDRPRVRGRRGKEKILPTYKLLTCNDPLNERILEQMVVGVSTRRYKRSLEVNTEGRATSKSAVSRRFVLRTQQQLVEWLSRPLGELELLALFLDGIEMGEHLMVVGVGVDTKGNKHVLGVWEGSTENTIVCQALLSNLAERGLSTEQPLLVVIDGSKALRKAVKQTFGQNAIVQRCQQHKRRNVAGQLPEGLGRLVDVRMRQAYQSDSVDKAQRILNNLSSQLEEEHPGAAASLREGLEETLTVVALGLPKTLRQSLQTTNIIESTLSIVRDVSRNVKRWQNGGMALRWTVTGLIEAEKRFKRIRGYRALPILTEALQQKRGLDNLKEAA